MADETQDNQQGIGKELRDYTQKNAYGVSLIPAHSHNGVDSNQIDPRNLMGFPTVKVASALTAPVDTPINGTIRYLYDGTNYVQWVMVNKVWTATALGSSPSAIYELLANKSTNTALGTSDTLYPSQKAAKTYADTKSAKASGAVNGDIASVDGSGNVTDSGKVFSTDGTLAGNSDANIPTQKAVKTYVDAHGTMVRDGKLTLSGVHTATYTMGATYDQVVCYLTLQATVVSDISLQVESDTSSNYNFSFVNNNSVQTTLATNRWILADGGLIVGQITLDGKGGGIQSVAGNLASHNTSGKLLVRGNITTGTNLTTLTFINYDGTTNGLLTGTVSVFGINY